MTPKADKDQREGGIQVIARAGAILRALSGHPQGVSLSSLAKPVSVSSSSGSDVDGKLYRSLSYVTI